MSLSEPRPTLDLAALDDAALLHWVWNRLAAAADTPEDSMHLHVLATTAEGGGPDARLMVLRGASEVQGAIWYHADAASTKIRQMQADPAACVVVYDAPTDLQLRLRGTASIVTSDEEIRAHWHHIRAIVQQLRHDTGEAPPHDLRLEALNRSDHDPAWQPDHFAVIQIHPNTIDVLSPQNGAPRRRRLTVEHQHSRDDAH
ncbi:MAG: pyridoxamine 5'-phosphate oxidase family protein [Phycisphaerales bacterium]|jgi:general stress protein 26|nr:pyridoxamine 5'-phosphate oxidase family protein [Phycisphaerales bacterium]